MFKKFFRKPVRLTYTEEMRDQDRLYEIEKEDRTTMERLHKSIVKEAIHKGFKGAAETINYNDNNGVITEVFRTQNDLEKERLTGDGLQIASCGYCHALINVLENEINNF